MDILKFIQHHDFFPKNFTFCCYLVFLSNFGVSDSPHDLNSLIDLLLLSFLASLLLRTGNWLLSSSHNTPETEYLTPFLMFTADGFKP